MPRNIRPYMILNECEDCGSHTVYSLEAECDHNDGHVSIFLSKHPCDSCMKIFDHIEASGDTEQMVWFSVTQQTEVENEEELLQAEGLMN